MALTFGTNVGFVLTAPTTDPQGTEDNASSNRSIAIQDTPTSDGTITEIGWWSPSLTGGANFEVAIYEDSSDAPVTRLAVNATNAGGADTPEWKRAVISYDIKKNTKYWIAIEFDDAYCQFSTIVGKKGCMKYTVDTLDNPFGTPNVTNTNIRAIYALYTPKTSVATATTTSGYSRKNLIKIEAPKKKIDYDKILADLRTPEQKRRTENIRRMAMEGIF